MKLIVCAILVFISGVCSGDEHTKIVGGELVKDIKSACFIALITYKNRPHCGGSIITSNHILTAAHCTDNAKPTHFKVKTGTTDIHDGEIHIVFKIDQHPDYNSDNYDYDFSILTVDRIYFNERQKPIALVKDASETPTAGKYVRVMGWGNTMNPLESSDSLRVVLLKVVDHKTCEKQYERYNMKIEDNKICACHPNDVDGKDACQGDSGGPLQSEENGKLCGVVSFGLGCAKIKYSGVYSRVDSALEWIHKIAGI